MKDEYVTKMQHVKDLKLLESIVEKRIIDKLDYNKEEVILLTDLSKKAIKFKEIAYIGLIILIGLLMLYVLFSLSEKIYR